MPPVVPRLAQTTVALEVNGGQISRRGTGQSFGHLGQWRRASGLRVDRVERPHRASNAVFAKPFEEHGRIQIITDSVASDQKPRLDSRHFGERGNTQALDLLRLERARPPDLANAGNIEAVAKIGHAEAEAMAGVDGRSRAANEHRAGHQVLQVAFGRQQPLPVRELVRN